MPHLRLVSLCCVFLLCLAPTTTPVCLAKALAPPPPPPQAYCVTDLGSLNNEDTRAYDINNSTEIVGTSWVGTFIKHPFFWAGGVMQDLGTVVAGTSTSANRINEYGWIVGTGRDAAGFHPYLFQPHYGFTDLGQIGGAGQGEAFTINNKPSSHGSLGGRALS